MIPLCSDCCETQVLIGTANLKPELWKALFSTLYLPPRDGQLGVSSLQSRPLQVNTTNKK